MHILGKMHEMAGGGAKALSDWAPRLETFKINPEKIRDVIGKGGATLKKVGEMAREDLEAFFGTKVYLDLWVKVKENWRESDFAVGNLGFKREEF